MWKCRLCGWTGEIPDDAFEIDLARSRGTRRGKLYTFGGVIHDLRKLPEPKPSIVAEPNPPVMEQTQEVQQPEQLPEPEIVEEVKPVVAEIEPELTTALAMAFRRRKQIQN
jgi:hypothetical protein